MMADPDAREADRIRAYYEEATWGASDGRRALVAERRAVLERLVRERLPPLAELSVCDVGCGAGSDLARWSEIGVPQSGLFGTELIAERAVAARARLPGASIQTVEGFEIPHADGSFDLVTASLVLSSILERGSRRALLAEIGRVARPDGIIAIYDFRVRKPWNPNVVAITRDELSAVLGPPTAEHRLAPFLPLLDLALHSPEALREPLLRLLPRTHRLYVWSRGEC